jgi:thymidylate kinase
MLISIEGIAQSGKTSIIKYLTERFPNVIYFDINGGLGYIPDEDSMVYLLRRATYRASIQTQLCLLLSQDKHIIVESYDLWFKAMCTINGISEMYISLSNTIRKPNLIIYLNTDIEIAYIREGRVFDKNEENRLLNIYNREHEIEIINTTNKTIEQVYKKVREILYYYTNQLVE